MRKTMDPVKPGEILLEEFLSPLGLSQNELARALNVPPRRINEIVLGKRRITADTALRLSRYFSMSEGFWTNLQDRYDREVARAQIDDLLLDIEPFEGNNKGTELMPRTYHRQGARKGPNVDEPSVARERLKRRLAEMREQLSKSNGDVPERSGTSPANASQPARRDDMHLSSIAAQVHALGGQLQINAVVGDTTYRLIDDVDEE
jgi:addiction module HigA family antidote